MIQNAAEGKEDIRSSNAEQGCAYTELLIVINNNKLVHLTLWITSLQHFHCSLAEINSIVEKFLNSSITWEQRNIPEGFRPSGLNNFQLEISNNNNKP